MKTQIKKELHTKSIVELNKQLLEVRSEERVMKLDQQMGKLKNTSSLKGKRVEIAVIRTIINEKLVAEKFAKALVAEAKKEIVKKDKPTGSKTKDSNKEKKKSTVAKAKNDKKEVKNE